MKVSVANEVFRPITITLESIEEAITVRWVLNMALSPLTRPDEESGRCLTQKHYDIAGELLAALRDECAK